MQQPLRDLEFVIEPGANREFLLPGDTAQRGISRDRRVEHLGVCEQQPVQICGGIAERKLVPAEHSGEVATLGQQQLGRERAVHDCGFEAPHPSSVEHIVPTSAHGGGQHAGVCRALHEAGGAPAHFRGIANRKAAASCKTARQRGHGCNGVDHLSEQIAIGLDLFEQGGNAAKKRADDGAGVARTRHSECHRHRERQPGARALGERRDAEQLGRLLHLGGRADGHPNDYIARLCGEHRSGELTLSVHRVRTSAGHDEPRHCRGGEGG